MTSHADIPKSIQALDVVLCRATVLATVADGSYEVEFVRRDGTGEVAYVPGDAIFTVLENGEACEHDYQFHPLSDDFGVCSKCGGDADWDALSATSSTQQVDPPDARHSVADCERNLKRMPNYDPHRGVPAVFVCECGRRWEHCHDEAEGDSWVPADGDAESRKGANDG